MRTIPNHYLKNSYVFTQKVASDDDVTHNHSFFEIMYITNGSISHTVNNQTKIIGEGDMFCLRPKDKHRFNREFGNNCEHRDILISINEFKNACDFLSKTLYNYICSLPLPPHAFITHAVMDRLEENCTLLTLNSAEKYNLSLNNYIISEILNIFFNELFLKKYSYPEWVSNLIKKLENPANYLMDLSDLISDIHYNRTYISRVFKKYTNTTIVTYFLNCKLNYALLCLTTSDSNITEIAQKAGFYSITYFNRKFKEFFGKSPSSIKKESMLPPPTLNISKN